MKEREKKSVRELAKSAKKDYTFRYKGYGRDPFADDRDLSTEEHIQKTILYSDKVFKRGQYFDALGQLDWVGPFYLLNFAGKETVEKYIPLINKRLDRMRKSVYTQQDKRFGERIEQLSEGLARGYEKRKRLEAEIEQHEKEVEESEKRFRRIISTWGGRPVTATASIIGVLGGIFFLSTNITGNAISDLTTKTTSFLGAGLLVVGLVAGFFWIKDKRK